MKVSFEINLRTAGRWIIGLLLIWAALSKLANPQEFYTGLLAYHLPLGSGLAQTVAVVLPWVELLCGFLLLGDFLTGPALVWSSILFTLFALATGEAWLRGLNISCACFNLSAIGLSDHGLLAQALHSTSLAFLRALGLAALSLYLLKLEIALRPNASVIAPQTTARLT